jgi:hypothetical protein
MIASQSDSLLLAIVLDSFLLQGTSSLPLSDPRLARSTTPDEPEQVNGTIRRCTPSTSAWQKPPTCLLSQGTTAALVPWHPSLGACYYRGKHVHTACLLSLICMLVPVFGHVHILHILQVLITYVDPSTLLVTWVTGNPDVGHDPQLLDTSTADSQARMAV